MFREIMVIFRKELRSYFVSPLVYTIFAVILFIAGFLFYSGLANYLANLPVIAGGQIGERSGFMELVANAFFLRMTALFILLLPLLCMRVFAEENRTGTMELLLTSPVSKTAIIAGKFLAVCLIQSIIIAIPAGYFLLLKPYAGQAVDVPQLFTAAAGSFLFSAALISFGLLASSLTKSQLVAALIAFAFNFTFLSVQSLSYYFVGKTGEFMARLSLVDHLQPFVQGIVDTRDLLYFLSLAGLGFFFTYLSSGADRKERIFSSLGLGISAVLAVLLINTAFHKTYLRVDLSGRGLYTLSERTRDFTSGLSNNFEMAAFFRRTDENYFRIRELLECFAALTPNVKYQFIDPDRQPQEAAGFGNTSYKVLIIRNNTTGKSEKLFSITEERLINALVKLSRKEIRNIFFLSGHGERDLSARDSRGYYELQKKLSERGFQVRELFLPETGSIPENTALLVLADAQSPLLPDEWSMVKKYLLSGGRALFLIDPSPSYSFAEELREFGVFVRSSVLSDSGSSLFGGEPSVLMVNRYGNHESVNGLSVSSVFSGAREIGFYLMLPKNIRTDLLALPGKSAVSSVQDPSSETPDVSRLPLGLAGVLRCILEEKEGKPVLDYRIAVSGDADFCSNHFLDHYGNLPFTMNLFSWLADEGDYLATDLAKKGRHIQNLSTNQLRFLFYLVVITAPLLFFLTGIFVYLRRRN
ncbi:MAG: Gldg family protein [Candidatus Wallbacteria bacterium]|nr:Gldg family protein [Candidatus Wallbacteria bacterium]